MSKPNITKQVMYLIDLIGDEFTTKQLPQKINGSSVRAVLYRLAKETKEIRRVERGKYIKIGWNDSKRILTHGHASSGVISPEYSAFRSMHNRCRNKKLDNYHNYGGRGIKVCKRWKVFKAFISDMGFRPSKTHSLDRIDNDGNYSPENCRWASKKDQLRNTRRNKLVTHNGETHCVADWAKIKKMNASTLHTRIFRNWPIEKIFNPLKK